jgi:hypothetical protein
LGKAGHEGFAQKVGQKSPLVTLKNHFLVEIKSNQKPNQKLFLGGSSGVNLCVVVS